MFQESCRNCKNANWICVPPNVSCICNSVGIGVTIHNLEFLESVGCKKYSYDGFGITDLDRKLSKRKGN